MKKLFAALAVLVLLAPTLALASDIGMTLVTSLDISILDKDGGKIKNAEVTIQNTNGTVVCKGSSGNKAIFNCQPIRKGQSYRIKISADSFERFENKEVLRDFGEDNLKIAAVLRPEKAELVIRVLDEDGKYVKDAEVTVESKDSSHSARDYGNYDYVAFPGGASEYKAFKLTSSHRRANTDRHGKVTYDLQELVNYEIKVKKDDYESETKKVFMRLDSDGKEEEITLSSKEPTPGTGTLTVTIYDLKTKTALSGAAVVVMGKTDRVPTTLTTNDAGMATFSLTTPECYDLQASKDGFGSDINPSPICLENGGKKTQSLYLTQEHKPPVADAGPEQYAVAGQELTLDASASTDPEGDELHFSWKDSLGAHIPDGENPMVTFQTPGEHLITLTVDDGVMSDTAETKVIICDPADCGDAVCSECEKQTTSCPQDCPVCGDGICAASEASPDSPFYCPGDCGVNIGINMLNSSAITPGDKVVIELRDPNNGKEVMDGTITVAGPDGQMVNPNIVGCRADFRFDKAGTYTIQASSPEYVENRMTVNVFEQGGDSTIWIIIIIVVAAGAGGYLFMRKK
jgi:hypothetical protein